MDIEAVPSLASGQPYNIEPRMRLVCSHTSAMHDLSISTECTQMHTINYTNRMQLGSSNGITGNALQSKSTSKPTKPLFVIAALLEIYSFIQS
jgi:hypothetical protein